MRKITTFFIFSLLLTVMACTSIDCPVNSRVYCNYALRQANGKPDSLFSDSLWVTTFRVNGTLDTVLNAITGEFTTSFELPISYTQPEDIFFFTVADEDGIRYVDTVRIKKQNIPHFESVDCQAAYFHELEAVSCTHNALDSISIHYRSVNYDYLHDHFYVYLKKDRS